MREYFRYVRGFHGKGLAAIMIKEIEGGNFQIGVSVCSPKDVFDKKTAREIATAKCEASPVFTFYNLVDGDWFDDVMSTLPHNRDEVTRDIGCEIFNMIGDIESDYAKAYYKTLMG